MRSDLLICVVSVLVLNEFRLGASDPGRRRWSKPSKTPIDQKKYSVYNPTPSYPPYESAHPTRHVPAYTTTQKQTHKTATHKTLSQHKYVAYHPTRYPPHHGIAHPTKKYAPKTTHPPTPKPTTKYPSYPVMYRPVYRPNPVYYPMLPTYQYYPVPQQPLYQPPVTKRPDPARTVLLLYAFMNLLNPTTTTTTTATATPTGLPGTCQWGAWSSCSAVCSGTRTRSRMCAGNTIMDLQSCNTQVGFRPDGIWYRASNCLEYLWSTDRVSNQADAASACSNRGARLASTGLRDESVRASIVSTFASIRGINNIGNAFVGISNADDDDVYVWSDGYRGDPTFWANGQPTAGLATNCILLERGNSFGLRDDDPCVFPTRGNPIPSYLCERAA